MIRGTLAAVVLVLSVSAAAEVPAWQIEEGSRVGFVARQSGAPVEGVFKRFTAEIRFAPRALAQSRVEVVVEVASVDSESSDRDAVIRSQALFDVAAWPHARFVAERFSAVAEGVYRAEGRLTLRDVTRDVVLPFTLEIAPDPHRPGRLTARARGELAVPRLDYGVGQGLWRDTSVVADEVLIRIDIRASRPVE